MVYIDRSGGRFRELHRTGIAGSENEVFVLEAKWAAFVRDLRWPAVD